MASSYARSRFGISGLYATRQERNGLKIDGYALPGGPTEQAINNNLVGKPRGAGLAQGFEIALGDSVGNGFANQPRDVQTVKRALGGLGYLPEDPFDRPSGFVDEATTNAVRGFQNDNRLKTDGWLGPGGETEAALRSAGGAPCARQRSRVA